MHLTGLDRLLWAFCLFGHCVLLVILLVRGRWPRFPVFTSLISFDILRTVALYLILRDGSSASYTSAYWTLGIVDVGLQLAVAYEIGSQVFRPLGAWAPDVQGPLLTFAGIGLVVASVLTWLASPPTRTLRSVIVLRGTFFSSALMGELLVAMAFLSVTLGLPWRTHVARLAQGLGVYSIFCILTEAGHSYFGVNFFRSISHLRILLYLGCLAYWILTLSRQEPRPRRLPEALREELSGLQRRAASMLLSLRTPGSSS